MGTPILQVGPSYFYSKGPDRVCRSIQQQPSQHCCAARQAWSAYFSRGGGGVVLQVEGYHPSHMGAGHGCSIGMEGGGVTVVRGAGDVLPRSIQIHVRAKI